MKPLLEATGLSVGYAGRPYVRDLDLAVHEDEIVALLGANGSGKTTALSGLAGLLPALGGQVRLAGEDVTSRALHLRARRGMAFVMDDRSVFMQLSVADNLRVGRCDPDEVVRIFPELRPLLGRMTGLLSGGEQQMLTLGRALTRPQTRILIVDELSMGLAPMVVERILEALRTAAHERGLGVLLVEQQLKAALSVATTVAFLSHGRVVLQGPTDEVTSDMTRIEKLYLAGGAAVNESPSEEPST